MKIYHNIEDILPRQHTRSLAIGTFDGIHRGHIDVLKKASAVVTFTNHPYDVLKPESVPKLLSTFDMKVTLFEKNGIDIVIAIPFTATIARLTAKEFLKTIRQNLTFDMITVGYDAYIGKGDIDLVSKELGIAVEHVAALYEQGAALSSSRIRSAVSSGNLTAAEKMLGRKYSLTGFVKDAIRQKKNSAEISLEGMCLPPQGRYAITTVCKGEKIPGIATIGVATTNHVFELCFLEEIGDLHGNKIEIIFEHHIKNEHPLTNQDTMQQDITLNDHHMLYASSTLR